MSTDTYTHTHCHTSISRVHGDEHRASWVEVDLCPLKEQNGGARIDTSLNGQDLLSKNRQYFKINAVEFIEARPRPTRRQALEEFAQSNVVKTIRTVEHNTLRMENNLHKYNGDLIS